MTGLLRNPVNPLNASAAPAQEAYVPTPPEAYATQVDYSTGEMVLPEINPAPMQVPAQAPVQVPAVAHPVALAPTTGMMSLGAAPVPSDSFSNLKVGFGAFPRLKMDAGKFWAGSEMIGTEFLANLVDQRPLFVIRDRENSTEKGSQVIWSYDGETTTQGQRVADVRASWAMNGQSKHVIRETSEVLAIILDGKFANRLVTFAVPQQSVVRLAGYSRECELLHRRAVSQVVTRIYVGEPIKGSTATFTPWGFQYVGPYEVQAAA